MRRKLIVIISFIKGRINVNESLNQIQVLVLDMC